MHVERIDQCAPSDERKSLELSLYSFIILTDLSVSIRPERIIHFFVGSWLCVPSFLVTKRVALAEHFHFHKVVAEQVFEDLVVNKVPLKKILSRTRSYLRSIVPESTILMSDYEEDFTDFQNYSKNSTFRIIGWSMSRRVDRSMDSIWWKFHHFLMGQLLGPNMRSSSTTGWILHSWKLENVDQH